MITYTASHHDISKIYEEGDEFLKIIILSDWLSSGETDSIEENPSLTKKKRTTIPLRSIFSEIRLDSSNSCPKKYVKPITYADAIEQKHYPLKIDSFTDISEEYRHLWTDFCKEIDGISTNDIEGFFYILLHLLKKYTSFLPSAVWKNESDVSLFDHMKMSSAIADCLYKFKSPEHIDRGLKALVKKHQEKQLDQIEEKTLQSPMFNLIGGDISGIQTFIYSIVSKKAAKSLKGRSFYLEILTEMIVQYILDKLDLTETNLLYCAGGHFYILAPLEIDITSIRNKISKAMYGVHDKTLYLAIDSVPLSFNDFQLGKFSQKWSELSKVLSKRKKKKFNEVLQLIDFSACDTVDVCFVCGKPVTNHSDLIVEDDVKKCKMCNSLEELSRDAIKPYLVINKSKQSNEEESWSKVFNLLGYHVSFHNDISRIKKSDYIIKINDQDFLIKTHERGKQGFRFYYSTKSKEFEKLAENATGIKRWGVLKGDVDNLGKIFSSGLGEQASISRLSTLSSMISLFFSGHMVSLCSHYADKVYGIYAGGDDFFIVGSWDILPEIGKIIRDDFGLFTCQNSDITLSVGISIAPSQKYPIFKISSFANDELNKAKLYPGKNAVSFLGKAMDWGRFADIEAFKVELSNLQLPGSFFQKLNDIHFMYLGQDVNHGSSSARYDDRCNRWRWMLSYMLSRTKINNRDEIRSKIRDNIEDLDVIVRWVELLKRGESV
jgi:CRISPR-associated protein Csm1